MNADSYQRSLSSGVRYDMSPVAQLHARPNKGQRGEVVNELSLAAELGDSLSFNTSRRKDSSRIEIQSEDDIFTFPDAAKLSAGDCESYGTSDSAVEDVMLKGEYGAQKYEASDVTSLDGSNLRSTSPLIEPAVVGGKTAQNLSQNSIDTAAAVRNVTGSQEEKGMLECHEEMMTKSNDVNTSGGLETSSGDSISSEEAAGRKPNSLTNEHDDWSFVEHHDYAADVVTHGLSIVTDVTDNTGANSFVNRN